MPLTSIVRPLVSPTFSLAMNGKDERGRLHRRPQQQVRSPPRGISPSCSSRNMSNSTKAEIQRMVKAVLGPRCRGGEINKDQYTDTNRDVSRMLYDMVGDAEGLANQDGREKWQEVASAEVERAIGAIGSPKEGPFEQKTWLSGAKLSCSSSSWRVIAKDQYTDIDQDGFAHSSTITFKSSCNHVALLISSILLSCLSFSAQHHSINHCDHRLRKFWSWPTHQHQHESHVCNISSLARLVQRSDGWARTKPASVDFRHLHNDNNIQLNCLHCGTQPNNTWLVQLGGRSQTTRLVQLVGRSQTTARGTQPNNTRLVQLVGRSQTTHVLYWVIETTAMSLM